MGCSERLLVIAKPPVGTDLGEEMEREECSPRGMPSLWGFCSPLSGWKRKFTCECQWNKEGRALYSKVNPNKHPVCLSQLARLGTTVPSRVTHSPPPIQVHLQNLSPSLLTWLKHPVLWGGREAFSLVSGPLAFSYIILWKLLSRNLRGIVPA